MSASASRRAHRVSGAHRVVIMLLAGAVAGCATGGYGVEEDVGYGVDYYEPYGFGYDWWGPGYWVGPPGIRPRPFRGPGPGGRPPRPFRPAPAGHPVPSIPTAPHIGGGHIGGGGRGR